MAAVRILYVQPNSEVGGSDLALYRMVRQLDKGQFQPIVVLPGPGPLVEPLRAAGAEVHFLPMRQLRGTWNPAYQARYLAGFWQTVGALAHLIRREGIALVHTNSMFCLYGGWAAARVGRPHIWHIREILQGRLGVRRVVIRMVPRLSTRIIVMTQAIRAMFGDGAADEDKFVTIPDGIDPGEFHPGVDGARIRRELGVSPDAPLVGFVARLVPWKGLDVFLGAAAKVAEEVPAARFLISGGPVPGSEGYAEEMRRLAARLGIAERVLFTDWRYRLHDIPEVMSALDVFVHASVIPEPFGLVLIEAMAVGRPVIATAAGGVPEVVAHGETGLLVRPGDVAGQAEAILALLRDPARGRGMGRAGVDRVRKCFTLKAQIAKVEGLYQAVLAGGAIPREEQG
ncbi:MAG: glycosyltransferase [Chloroflexi bacterium]|nr:glycosyltransferase [Chloroflexota bacterium]